MELTLKLDCSGPVQWSFIENLQQLQQQEGLRAGTKLTKLHIQWEKNKMKCSLAAQVLSESVASAIDFLREDLEMDDFQLSKPTTEFIRLIPLKSKQSYLLHMFEWGYDVRCTDGRPNVNRLTFRLGLIAADQQNFTDF